MLALEGHEAEMLCGAFNKNLEMIYSTQTSNLELDILVYVMAKQ